MTCRASVFGLALSILGISTSSGLAAPVPVKLDCTSILCIQPYNLGEGATDQTYLLVTGEAAGKAIDQRVPARGTWEAAPKHPAVNDDQPAPLWSGSLDDGQFVLFTVNLMQGKGTDAARNKQFLDKLAAADQKVPEWSKKTLTEDDFKKLAENTLKADRAVIKDIKQLYSRDKDTDHYGGQFTVIVWNNAGKLVKRLDPVGLTFGEHNGNDIKIYSKLKLTRNNVLVKDQGQWQEQQLEPLNDDQDRVRVKELETEYVKQAAGNPIRHVTDYLVELRILGSSDKPLIWELGDMVTGVDNIHWYWNSAH